MTKTPEALWYVLHTTCGKETDARTALEEAFEASGVKDALLEVIAPKQAEKTRLSPGYLLIKLRLDDTTWRIVSNTPGVSGFVGMGRQPTPLDEFEVENIRFQMGLTERTPRRPQVSFASHDLAHDQNELDQPKPLPSGLKKRTIH